MLKSTGYFIAEILISLFLCASISLLLLKQQWQISRFTGDIETHLETLSNSENKYEQSIRGFSLSEILICLLLASLLLTGLIKQYAQVYRQDNILNARLEQNADLQLVSELLRNSLRVAGFTPCGNLNNLRKDLNQELSAIQIFQNGVEIIRMSEHYSEFANKVDALQFLNKTIKSKHLMITDCYHAAVISNIHDSLDWNIGLNFIVNNYIPPIYIGTYINEKFWIKDAKYLYYKFKNSEKISDYINGLEVGWLDDNLIKVNLMLLDDKITKLLVMLRNKEKGD